MQQQQQEERFDLLAVFNEQSNADAAEAKLRKEGFGDEEVFRPTPALNRQGEFREHGPNRDRSSIFLQTTRTGPNPLTVILLAVVFGIVLGGISFGVFDFGVKGQSVLLFTLLGVLLGAIIGAVIGLTRRGRIRGDMGQRTLSRSAPPATPGRSVGEPGTDKTVVAIRLPDPEDISRKSKARAILINSGGKIDRSVSR